MVLVRGLAEAELAISREAEAEVAISREAEAEVAIRGMAVPVEDLSGEARLEVHSPKVKCQTNPSIPEDKMVRHFCVLLVAHSATCWEVALIVMRTWRE